MLTPPLMTAMSDAQLVAAMHAEFDPLFATDKEAQLLARLESMLPHADLIALNEEAEIDTDDLKSVLEHSLDFPTIAQILDVLAEYSIETPGALREKLERANKFYDIASDAGDVIYRLSDLVAENN